MGLENLESRRLLSGNVSAVVSGGTLFITGDAGDQGVALSRNELGQYTVEADVTTTVNGQSGVIVLGDYHGGGLVVRLGQGNDELLVRDFAADAPMQLGGDVSIDAGAGDD